MRRYGLVAGSRLRPSVAKFFAQCGRELVARRNDDFVLHARVVRQDDIAVRAVAEKADDGGMLALDDLDDAAFGAAIVAAANNAREDAIAVHGVAHIVAADEEIAVDAGNGLVGHNEAVAIAMGDRRPAMRLGSAARLGLPLGFSASSSSEAGNEASDGAGNEASDEAGNDALNDLFNAAGFALFAGLVGLAGSLGACCVYLVPVRR